MIQRRRVTGEAVSISPEEMEYFNIQDLGLAAKVQSGSLLPWVSGPLTIHILSQLAF